jgi:hypothetical protein
VLYNTALADVLPLHAVCGVGGYIDSAVAMYINVMMKIAEDNVM